MFKKIKQIFYRDTHTHYCKERNNRIYKCICTSFKDYTHINDCINLNKIKCTCITYDCVCIGKCICKNAGAHFKTAARLGVEIISIKSY